MKRRTFLLAGLGTTGALVMGWSLTPPRQRLYPSDAPTPEGGGVALNGWLAIAPDDSVTIIAPKAEMGQGIHTALAMLVAEELDCDWSRVRVVHSGVDKIYNNAAAIVDGLPFSDDMEAQPLVRGVRWLTVKTMREVGVMMTGGSSSVRDTWEVARDAGATARAALVATAAARAGVAVSACRTERGVVTCGDRQFRYGELVGDASARRETNVTRKSPEAFTIIGTSRARLDTDDVLHGRPLYGMDVTIEGMRYAAVLMPPALGCTVVSFDKQAATTRPGVEAVVELAGSSYGNPPGLAVVARSWWEAKQALAYLNARWSESPHATLSSDGIMRTLRSAAAGDGGLPYRSDGNAMDALDTAARVLDVTYEAPYLAHVTMEPMNATVRVNGATAELWTGTQVPGLARAAAASVLRMSEDSVTLHQLQLGGGFGRRLEADYVAQAADIARALPGVPVQMIWSREDDMRHDFYRPAGVTRMRAALDGAGTLESVVVQSAGQSPFQALGARMGITAIAISPDKTAAEGTFEQPYEFPAMRVAHTDVPLPVPVGSWRSVGHSYKGFVMESFVDELAHDAKVDPVRYRQRLLQQHPRARAVLDLVADKSGWFTPLAAAPNGGKRARGVALHWSYATIVALVAEVLVRADGSVRVERVTVAADAGLIVNPSGAAQQVEGGVLFGLQAALHGEVLVKNGRIEANNFNDYRALRMSEAPAIACHFVPSTHVPSGLGEPAVPVVAPAVANALFAITGVRLRTLPLRLPVAEQKT
ncbi:molybdopterin cofactor-binding domain-containing protein [Gemmatimonas sp.]|uniref:xanthine dehydrogenase family protein molybdopterin-binding subunit n=1 Tax=Gemmatimonas sp. TaxID=1962908 RepID=UPI003DA29A29